MNCFFILLLYFLARVRCDYDDEDQEEQTKGEITNVLASVRQYPSMLHRCVATFITTDVLLTTARCLYCKDCDLFIRAYSNKLTDDSKKSEAKNFYINKTVIHPDYEMAPLKNDIGLIQLNETAPKPVIFHLPTKSPNPTLIVDTFRWQFQPNHKDYFLEKVKEKIISNAACSAFFNQYIDLGNICTHRNESVFLGSFDEGVPLVDNTTGKPTIFGIYVVEGKFTSLPVEIYQAIFPSVNWINAIIKCHFNCTSAEETVESTATSTVTFPVFHGGPFAVPQNNLFNRVGARNAI